MSNDNNGRHANAIDLRGDDIQSSDHPLVSIVIPTHNHAHFLAEALQSALNQTISSIEVIVIDDGSTDDPASVVARFRGVQLIQQARRGLAAARNTGLRAASGKYVSFLDADDRLLPDAIAINVKRIAASSDCAFVFGSYRMIDMEGRVFQVAEPSVINGEAFRQFLEGNQIGMHATVLYRRDRLAEIGGFDEQLRACEDYDLYLRIARAYQIKSGPEYLADYRQHTSNMSLNLPLMLNSSLKVLRRQKRYLGKDRELQEAFRRGIQEWQLFYLEKYTSRVRSSSRRWQDRWALAADGVKMFWLAPTEFLRIVFWAAYRRLSGRVGQKHAG